MRKVLVAAVITCLILALAEGVIAMSGIVTEDFHKADETLTILGDPVLKLETPLAGFSFRRIVNGIRTICAFTDRVNISISTSVPWFASNSDTGEDDIWCNFTYTLGVIHSIGTLFVTVRTRVNSVIRFLSLAYKKEKGETRKVFWFPLQLPTVMSESHAYFLSNKGGTVWTP